MGVMQAKRSIRAKAYASVANLGWGFDVFGLAIRAGFDIVEIARGHEGMQITVDGPYAGQIPADSFRNTAGLAVKAMIDQHDLTEPIAMRITKGIRCGSGMGSSAASAAAAVTAADAWFRLNLPKDQLVKFAAEGERASAGAPHADNVAACVFGGLTICLHDETMYVMHLQPPTDMRVVVALPHVHVDTRTARSVLPTHVDMKSYVRGCGRCATIVAAISRGDVLAFGRALEGSFVDQARASLIPGFEKVRAAAKAAGAAGVTISGAGPAMVAIVAPHGDAKPIGEAMRVAFREAGVDSDIHVATPARGATILEDGE